jgi:hypothetical protein
MDELHILHMPPRSKVSLLTGATSSSMLRGDSEIKCLHKELVDGALDDDSVFLEKRLEDTFHMIASLTLNTYTWGFYSVTKHTREIYRRVEL